MAPDTAFYDQRAASYAAASHDMDLRPLYARFLPHVRPGGLILDAGCGSGRDALAFRQAGFRVEAFDASPQMARQAALLLGQEVPVLCFEDVAWQERFDGIWACASLLHVAPADLPDVLRRLQRALRPGGVMFFNFKYGQGQRHSPDGRRFTDMDEAGVRALLGALPGAFLPRYADRGGRPCGGAAGTLDPGPCPAHPLFRLRRPAQQPDRRGAASAIPASLAQLPQQPPPVTCRRKKHPLRRVFSV